jgi:hypothetical protein
VHLFLAAVMPKQKKRSREAEEETVLKEIRDSMKANTQLLTLMVNKRGPSERDTFVEYVAETLRTLPEARYQEVVPQITKIIQYQPPHPNPPRPQQSQSAPPMQLYDFVDRRPATPLGFRQQQYPQQQQQQQQQDSPFTNLLTSDVMSHEMSNTSQYSMDSSFGSLLGRPQSRQGSLHTPPAPVYYKRPVEDRPSSAAAATYSIAPESNLQQQQQVPVCIAPAVSASASVSRAGIPKTLTYSDSAVEDTKDCAV